MNPEILRAAAARLRDTETDPRWRAVADWLDSEAAAISTLALASRIGMAIHPHDENRLAPAAAVARLALEGENQ